MMEDHAAAGALWTAMPPEPLRERVQRLLDTFASDSGFSVAGDFEPADSFGAWD
jgi:hypothetical protein